MPKKIQGLKERQVYDADRYLRDTNSIGERLYAVLGDPVLVCSLIALLFLISCYYTVIIHLTVPVAGLLTLLWHMHREENVLPLRLPVEADMTDYNDPKPGIRGGFNKARGMYYFGNEIESRQEIFLNRDDILQHSLFLGTTGAGKTEVMTALMANTLTMGGGCVYGDAKGAADVLWTTAAMARAMGREDDLLIINYITGGRNVAAQDTERLSNDTNPFARGSADSNTQMLTSLLKEQEGDNAVFFERAVSLVSSIMYPLTELRDRGELELGASVIRQYLNLDRVVELSRRTDLSEKSLNAVGEYLRSLPGYNPEKPCNDQPPEVAKQFGFAQMYFTRALSSLSDTYGHIYWTTMGEIDYFDVIMNRRILVFMLPAIEKAGAERKNLGKIILSGIKDALAIGLGRHVEGDREDVLDNKPTNSSIPTSIILDEYGYMAVEDFAVLPAQGRSMGFSFAFGAQDWPGIKKAGEEEAGQVWSNTNIKWFGRLNDEESIEKCIKAAGEAYTTISAGFDRPRDGLGLDYIDNLSASIEKRERVTTTDLQQQSEGEFHLLFKGKIIRGHSFFTAIDRLKTFRVNRFIKVPPRTGDSLLQAVTPGIDRPPRQDEIVPLLGEKQANTDKNGEGNTGNGDVQKGEDNQTPVTTAPADMEKHSSVVSDYADLFTDESQDEEAAKEQQSTIRSAAELSDDFLDEVARAEGRGTYASRGGQLFDASDGKKAVEAVDDAIDLANPDPVAKTAKTALNEGEKLLSAAVNELKGMG